MGYSEVAVKPPLAAYVPAHKDALGIQGHQEHHRHGNEERYDHGNDKAARRTPFICPPALPPGPPPKAMEHEAEDEEPSPQAEVGGPQQVGEGGAARAGRAPD